MKDILSRDTSAIGIAQRQHAISNTPDLFIDLFDLSLLPVEEVSNRNCENLIGSVVTPVGVVGPLIFTLSDTLHHVFAPLATTEGALIASVNRGVKVLSESQTNVQVEKVGMSRAPVFAFESGQNAQEFLLWINQHSDELKQVSEKTSNHLIYLSHTAWVRGRHVYVRFVFDTGNAMGMNMATIATTAIAEFIEATFPQSRLVAISSNVCTDKKDSSVNQILGRGYWVQAESFIAHTLIRELLHVEPDELVATHIQKNLVGSNIAGSHSQNAQTANILAALYLSTGQDPAHVVDGSQAALTIENQSEHLYAAITMPGVIVGTVGGGTNLPSQKQARLLIGHGQEITPSFLSGVIGVCALAGEVSLLASLSENSLSASHRRLGRVKTL